MLRSSLLILAALSVVDHARAWSMSAPDFGHADCKLSLAVTIPEKLNLPALSEQTASIVEPTHEALIRMIDGAKRTIRIASFYLKLTPDEPKQGQHPSTKPGADVREAIRRAGHRGVETQIIVDDSRRKFISSQLDIDYLKEFAQVKLLNMTNLIGGGILHSKFLIADNSTFYLGSANFDWQAYSQVKESGVVASECHDLAQDLDKIFRTYWFMSNRTEMPQDMGAQFSELHTRINLTSPIAADGLQVYLAGSPPAFNGMRPNDLGRTDDIDAILHLIKTAKRRIDISVMNYSPQLEFGWPKYYWPKIDDALREAALTRRVKVRLLFSRWSQTKPTDRMWYESLNSIQSPELRDKKGFHGIHVKLFEVPIFDDFQRSLEFSRVKHDKYMVTDGGLYMGTSNWTPDYFTNTCGVGLSMWPVNRASTGLQSESQIIRAMREIFARDFDSEYAHELVYERLS